MYYVLKSDSITKKDKAIIYTALAYLVLPIDILPIRKFPILGIVDEYLSIEIIFDRMQKYITPSMYAQAEKQLDSWIGKGI